MKQHQKSARLAPDLVCTERDPMTHASCARSSSVVLVVPQVDIASAGRPVK
jgi:hypothetical protein